MLTEEMRSWLRDADHPNLALCVLAFKKEFNLTGFETLSVLADFLLEILE